MNLVVMCAKQPSLVMSEKITEALKKETEEVDEGTMSKLEVHMFPEKGGMCVTNDEVNIKCLFIMCFIIFLSWEMEKFLTR